MNAELLETLGFMSNSICFLKYITFYGVSTFDVKDFHLHNLYVLIMGRQN